MIYHAMIGSVGYLDCEADNDDQARAKFAVMLDHRGGGLYRRWRDSGMRVAEFKRGLLSTREETRNVRTEDRTKALRVQVQRV